MSEFRDLIDNFIWEDKKYNFFNIKKIKEKYNIKTNTYTKNLILESLARNTFLGKIKLDDFLIYIKLLETNKLKKIPIFPSNVLLEDNAGLPLLLELATMRDILKQKGKDSNEINPVVKSTLTVDHTMQVNQFGHEKANKINQEHDIQVNYERYEFLAWCKENFKNLNVVPPNKGISHQLHMEFFSQVINQHRFNDESYLYPECLVGSDSHTPMINALGILGWGSGGIEVGSTLLGNPINILTPNVVGIKLSGYLQSGITATDIVLNLTQFLRTNNMQGKSLEFFGEGVKQLNLPDRATISNMCPEYGAISAIFPFDDETIQYLKTTRNNSKYIELNKIYFEHQNFFNNPVFENSLEFNLSSVKPSIAGPSNPHQRIDLDKIQTTTIEADLKDSNRLQDGSIVIAAITSCTNTINPRNIITAGILAKNAVEAGLAVNKFVKTSFAPGSLSVREYLYKSNLLHYLEKLGFNIVGFGCSTCAGSGGELKDEVLEIIDSKDVKTVSMISGNRNSQGRVHPRVPLNYLASPAIVIAYSIAGNLKNLLKEPIGTNKSGEEVHLDQIWPTEEEVNQIYKDYVTDQVYENNGNFDDQTFWSKFEIKNSDTFEWKSDSSYIIPSPFFSDELNNKNEIRGARCLLYLGDNITTDEISPGGKIPIDSEAAHYLRERGITSSNLNTYGARRGNAEVMVRGTFTSRNLKNMICTPYIGPLTNCFANNKRLSVYKASQEYKNQNIPLIVIAGENYGCGSSRDWAAKGPKLLGVKMVLAKSFEDLHRTNLINMGILPLRIMDKNLWEKEDLTGEEIFDFLNLEHLSKSKKIRVQITKINGEKIITHAEALIYSDLEYRYYLHGGLLNFSVRNQLKKDKEYAI